ncbi:hypothetical protein ACVIVC_002375 [Sinorhizobium meliloti]
MIVFTLNADPPVDSTEQRMPCDFRVLVQKPADGAARGIIDAGDAAGADRHEFLLRRGAAREKQCCRKGGDLRSAQGNPFMFHLFLP